jgi:hypothetical protein
MRCSESPPGLFCLAQAAKRARERAPWLLLGLGSVSWGVGNFYFLAVFNHGANVPFPSWGRRRVPVALPVHLRGVAGVDAAPVDGLSEGFLA